MPPRTPEQSQSHETAEATRSHYSETTTSDRNNLEQRLLQNDQPQAGPSTGGKRDHSDSNSAFSPRKKARQETVGAVHDASKRDYGMTDEERQERIRNFTGRGKTLSEMTYEERQEANRLLFEKKSKD
jgi:hypothetical protein